MISINEYFDLILMILLGLGLVFELPILIFFLSLFGIVTPKFLWRNFRYAILIIAVVAAIITPTPDAHDDADLHGADGGIVFCGDWRVRSGGARKRRVKTGVKQQKSAGAVGMTNWASRGSSGIVLGLRCRACWCLAFWVQIWRDCGATRTPAQPPFMSAVAGKRTGGGRMLLRRRRPVDLMGTGRMNRWRSR